MLRADRVERFIPWVRTRPKPSISLMIEYMERIGKIKLPNTRMQLLPEDVGQDHQ